MTLTVFSHHYYKWNGQIRLQRKEGPNGLRATQPVLQIVIDFLAESMKELAKKTVCLKIINPVGFETLEIKALVKIMRWGTCWDQASRTLISTVEVKT